MKLTEFFRYWMSRLFDLSPSMILLAVSGSLLAAFTLIIYGFLRVLWVIWELINARDLSSHQEGQLSIQFIELIDVFLIGVILLIVALGLYQLFIDDTIPVPKWMRVHDLMELKRDLVSVTVVLLAVTFLGEAVDGSPDDDIRPFGIAIAAVIVALAFFNWLSPNERAEE